jgi:hypothetical protein
MRDRVLLRRHHLTEGQRAAAGQKHGVVAEAVIAARRPNQRAAHPPLETLAMAIGPGQRQRRDEFGRTVGRVAKVVVEPPHPPREIAHAGRRIFGVAR